MPAADNDDVGRKSESVTKLEGGRTQTKNDNKRKKDGGSQRKPAKPPVVSGNPLGDLVQYCTHALSGKYRLVNFELSTNNI